MIVLDASVAVKWYFPEPGSDAAIELQGGKHGALVAPELFVVEVTAALVRKANMEKARKDDILILIADFLTSSDDGTIQTRGLSGSTARTAAELAIELGHPLKDCIYLVLAMEMGCPLVTADARFAAKARGVYGDVRVLGEAT